MAEGSKPPLGAQHAAHQPESRRLRVAAFALLGDGVGWRTPVNRSSRLAVRDPT